MYINVNSNHPRSIIRQIPNAVNIRINRLSSNKKIFYENNWIYDEVFERSGFKQRLEYLEILKDNFETCNNENNDNNNVKNNNNSNSNNSNRRTVNGVTNNRLNNTSERNNYDSNCRNQEKKYNMVQLPLFVNNLLLI